MSYNRRSFLKVSAALGGGYLLIQATGCNASSKLSGKDKPFGLQLYTLRDDMATDPKGTLKKVSEFGYKQIESFEGANGMFFGMTNKAFKQYMDDLGMTIVTSHCNINKDFEKKVDEAAEIGMKYLICPSYGDQKTVEGYKKAATVFNEKGAICKKAGLRFAYHNHEYEFRDLEGTTPEDILIQNTDKDLVDYEMDIYWVVTAGHNPIGWMKKYPSRFKLYHVKDRKKDIPNTTRAAFTTLGDGKIDFFEIAKLAEKNGDPYYFVEQDQADIPALDAVQKNARYLKEVLLPKI